MHVFVVIVCFCFIVQILKVVFPVYLKGLFIHSKKKHMKYPPWISLVSIVVLLNNHHLRLLHNYHIIYYVRLYVRLQSQQVYQHNNKHQKFKRNSSVYFLFNFSLAKFINALLHQYIKNIKKREKKPIPKHFLSTYQI